MVSIRLPPRSTLRVRSSRGLQNIEYRLGTIDRIAERDFQAICILDVLYLLPDEKKLEVLQACRDRLDADGVLLLKTNDTRPRWKYAVVRTEEELMVRAIGFTYGGEVHFRGVPRYLELLRQAGFDAQVISLDSWLPVPHRLFLAQTGLVTLSGIRAHADDLGLHPSVDRAIFSAYERGALSGASILVGGQTFRNAAAEARRLDMPVWLHLALVDAKPISPDGEIRSLIDHRSLSEIVLNRGCSRTHRPLALRRSAARDHASD